MIARLKGTVIEALPNRLVLDVQGVGYEIIIPLTTFDALNPLPGHDVTVRTYLHVREQALTLYGFSEDGEKDLFLLLIDRVSGIGPSIAIAVLGGMPAASFKQAVVDGDITAISSIKGIGKKTAERIVLELKDKIGVADTWAATSAGEVSNAAGEAEQALIALGYKQAAARKAVQAAAAGGSDGTTEDLIRAALR